MKIILSLLLPFLFVFSAWAQKGPVTTDPAEAANDPDFTIQGEYVLDAVKGGEAAGAQVVALGDGTFQAAFLAGGLPGEGWAGWQKAKRVLSQGKTADGKTTFENGAVIADGKLTLDGKTYRRVERKSPTLGSKPEGEHVMLFDGSSADSWNKGKLDGKLLCEGTSSKESFGDFKLHLEFRTPWKPTSKPGSQDRGNSGLYIFNRYETQILDSFGIKPEYNLCGSLYRTKTTDMNMCFPPLAWQTYDIEFTAPRLDADGKKTANARITTWHNGVLIHDDFELPKGTGAGGSRPEIAEGQLFLQGHGNPVRFRNIWIQKLDTKAAGGAAGFKPIFDGKSLDGWDGSDKFWSIEDGAITGITTKENPTKGNTFCIYKGAEPEDFILRCKFRIGEAGNSGIQFRSKQVKGNADNQHVISGYQADFDAAGNWTGTLYEEKGRGILAKRGNKVRVTADGKKQNQGRTAEEKDILAAVKKHPEWNQYEIIVKGNHIEQILNGVTTADVTDEHEAGRAMKGLIALQLHQGPPMKVQFKDIEVKEL